MKKILLILTLVLPLIVFSQFAVNTTTTPEFCSGTGKVQMNITGTTAGTSFDFLIYKQSDLVNPYRVITNYTAPSSTFSYEEPNLIAGSYTVKAYEDNNGVITQANSNFTITNNFTPLVFTVTQSEVCGGKQLSVNVSKGQPATYELRTVSGTVVTPSQASNVLAGPYTPGSYVVVVTDTCGNSQSLGVTVTAVSGVYTIANSGSKLAMNTMLDCNNIDHLIKIEYNAGPVPAYRYPLQVTITLNNPVTGIPEVTTETWTSEAQNNKPYPVPYYAGYSYDYTVSFVDACGNTATQKWTINDPTFNFNAEPALCGTRRLELIYFERISPPFDVKFTNYPAGFDPANYNSNFAPGTYSATYNAIPLSGIIALGSATATGVPAGSYTVELTNCGRTITKTITVTNSQSYLVPWVLPGCDTDKGSVALHIRNAQNINGSIVDKLSSLTITSAPADFVNTYGALPYNASYNITSADGSFRMNGLPAGNYTAEGVGMCGQTLTTNFTIIGKVQSSTYSITPNCGSFNITSKLTTNLYSPTVYLQKYYPAVGKWGHPVNPVYYTDGSTITAGTALEISSSGGTVSNISTTGDFRIMYQSVTHGNGTLMSTYCIGQLHTFTVNPNSISLDDYYVALCPGVTQTYTLYLKASGIGTLTYELIEKNGVAISINNGNSSIFNNLPGGIYKLKVSDACGNAKTFEVRVTDAKEPKIKAQNLCTGQNGKLFIDDALSFLTVNWTKGTNPTVIATGTTLNFAPFTTADYGVYHAKLFLGGTCIDTTIDFEVTAAGQSAPDAGTGQTVTISASSLTGPIDLFSYLTGTPDMYGTWTETTSPGSAALVDKLWYASSSVPSGTYTFQYKVNATCSNSTATSIVTINLANECTQPGNFTASGTPTNVGITTHQVKEDNWPEKVPDGALALASATKGFVITRVQNVSLIKDPKEGMLVYEYDADCMKLYNGTSWKCIAKGCNY